MKDHILVITENKNHELLLKKKLSSLSLIFVQNKSFKEEKLSHLRFLFIIIDESEGENTIFSLIKSIKSDANTKAAPILVISNKLKSSHIENLIHNGVSNFIPMPIADENIYQTLEETNAHKSTDEIIGKLKIPIIDASSENMQDHEVIPFKKVQKIKEALAKKESISLALIACKEKPDFKDDLLIQVTKSIYCLISTEKDTKQLYNSILKYKSKNVFAGIVSNDNKSYDDISSMINDAKNALARAKETPHGISFYTK